MTRSFESGVVHTVSCKQWVVLCKCTFYDATTCNIIRKPVTFSFLLSLHPTIPPFFCLLVCLSILHVSLLYISMSIFLSFPPSICLFNHPSFLHLFFPVCIFLSSFPLSFLPFFMLLNNNVWFCKSLATMNVIYHSDVGSQFLKKRSTMPFPLIFQFCKYTYVAHVFPPREIFFVMFNLYLVCLKLMVT